MEPDWAVTLETGWALREDESKLLGYFDRCTKEYPHSGRAKFELANALDFCSRDSEAIVLYEEALQLGLSEEYQIYAQMQMASSLRNTGNNARAQAILENAITLAPDMPSLRMFHVLTLCSGGHAQAALKEACEALLQHVRTPDMLRYRHALQQYTNQLSEEGSTQEER